MCYKILRDRWKDPVRRWKCSKIGGPVEIMFRRDTKNYNVCSKIHFAFHCCRPVTFHTEDKFWVFKIAGMIENFIRISRLQESSAISGSCWIGSRSENTIVVVSMACQNVSGMIYYSISLQIAKIKSVVWGWDSFDFCCCFVLLVWGGRSPVLPLAPERSPVSLKVHLHF